MDFYTETYGQKEKALWRMLLGIAIFFFSTAGFFAIPTRGHLLRALVVLSGQVCFAATAYCEIFVGWLELNHAYRDYCERRILPTGRRVHREYPAIPAIVPKKKLFWTAANGDQLKALEKKALTYLDLSIRIQEYELQDKRWKVQSEKLQPQLESLMKSPGIPEDERERLLKIGSDIKNPERKKRFMTQIERMLAQHASDKYFEHPASTAVVEVPAQPNAINDGLRLQLLEVQAQICRSEKAIALYQQALGHQDRRTRIRLLKQAIRQEQSAAPIPTTSETIKPEQAFRPSTDVKSIALNEILEKRFDVRALLPQKVDANMAKEILLVLIEPGRMERRFQNSYRVESRIKRRVVNRYNAWQDDGFDSRVFSNTIQWLVSVGVLRRKMKGYDNAISLSANTREAKTEEARALISAVLRFDQEIHGSTFW